MTRKVSENRVYIDDVQIEGHEPLRRAAVVTLMADEEEETEVPDTPAVYVGQRISGTGRLFTQEGVRNPGGIDWRISALADGYELSGYMLPGWTVSGDGVFSACEWLRHCREWISMRIEALFGRHAPFFQAVMIGDKGNLEKGLVQAMRLTGIAHLLTISGMHLTLMAIALKKLLRALRLGGGKAFAAETLLLGLYTCVTGCAAGTVRAYIMLLIRDLAKRTGRQYDALTALASAALMMTLYDPLWALSASFQFSYFVVLGIVLLGKRAEQCLCIVMGRKARGSLAQMAAVSVSAQIAALPMQLALYGYIPLAALPMNMLCGIVMPVIMIGGWCALAAGLLFYPLGFGIAALTSLATEALGGLLMMASESGAGILRLPAPYLWSVLIAAALMICISPKVYIGKSRRMLCAALAIFLALCYMPRIPRGSMYVQLDVGQGDAAVLRKGKQAVVIDAGPEGDYEALRYLRHEGLHPELLVLSHLDEDHAGALGVLLDSEIRIGRIAMPANSIETADSKAVCSTLDAARAAGISIEYYQQGDVIAAEICDFTVLAPTEEATGSNERSLALYADLDGLGILTLGDLPAANEMEQVPACDVLKVAHHGSKYATSRKLIEQAAPSVAIISVGGNSYGHPSQRVVSDLDAVGASVFRTDLSGCVTV
ncbi:MAG: DNA internalization-related competence protein ComEC/Rec2, partial [Clostridia bacterium]|nr:DNA internalization-related competence protein ComEC/Rec2 [Clostridia bacterium]